MPQDSPPIMMSRPGVEVQSGDMSERLTAPARLTIRVRIKLFKVLFSTSRLMPAMQASLKLRRSQSRSPATHSPVCSSASQRRCSSSTSLMTDRVVSSCLQTCAHTTHQSKDTATPIHVTAPTQASSKPKFHLH